MATAMQRADRLVGSTRFQNTFASFVNQLDTALATLTRGPHGGTVHRVGHARVVRWRHWRRTATSEASAPELYTFGSPRSVAGVFRRT